MKICLIAPTSYNYYKDMISTLEKRKCQVKYIPDFVPSFINRCVRFCWHGGISFLQNRYIRKQILKIRDEFDVIFLIRGYAFDLVSIRLLKEQCPNAKLIMYQWDPLSVSRFDISALSLFDQCYTFDYEDAKRYNIISKALFYSPEYNQPSFNSNIDISFIGACHSNRLYVLHNFFSKNKILHSYVKVNCEMFKFLKGCFFSYRLYKYANDKGWISFHSIPRIIAQQIFDDSKAILDIHHPLQNGLSIRVIEVLSKGKKLITTNRNILNESFYHPYMVCIIDEQGNGFDPSFLNFPHVKLDLTALKLDNWLVNLLNINVCK